jgi:hypothetical protein
MVAARTINTEHDVRAVTASGMVPNSTLREVS